MDRRQFLKAVGILTLGSSMNLQAQEAFPLKLTDPELPPELFEATYRELRQLQSLDDGLTPEQRLAKARAWLGGSPEFRPKLSPRGRWATAQYRGREVPVRVISPPSKSRGVVLSVHGGGWIMGCATSDESFNAELAARRQVTVVSPEYRLAPEHPFPAAPEDCETVARWLLSEGSSEFGSPRLGIVGFSAGAHLAALTLTRLSSREREKFQRAVFFYGAFQLDRSERWRKGRDTDFPDLTPSAMNRSLEHFLPGLSDQQRAEATYSPLAADLRAMPPALFLTGSSDLLYPDTRRMAEKWAKSGNPAELVVYEGAPHGFNGYDLPWKLNPNTYAQQFLCL